MNSNVTNFLAVTFLMCLSLPASATDNPLDYPLPVVTKRILTLAADHRLDPEPHYLAAKSFANVYQAQTYLLSFFHNLQLRGLYEKLLATDSRFRFSQSGRVSHDEVGRNRRDLLRALQQRALPFAALPGFVDVADCHLEALAKIETRAQLLAIYELLKANGEVDRELKNPLAAPKYDIHLLLEKIELFHHRIAWHELGEVFLKYRLDLNQDALKVIQYIVKAKEKELEREVEVSTEESEETDFLTKAEKLLASRAVSDDSDEHFLLMNEIDAQNPLKLGDSNMLSELIRFLGEHRLPPRGYVEVAQTLSTPFQLRAFYLSLRSNLLWISHYERLAKRELRFPGTTEGKSSQERRTQGDGVALFRERLRAQIAKRMVPIAEIRDFIPIPDMSTWKGLSRLETENQMDALKAVLSANLRNFATGPGPLVKDPITYDLTLFLENADLFKHPVAVTQTKRIFLANQLELNAAGYSIIKYLVESVSCQSVFSGASQ